MDYWDAPLTYMITPKSGPLPQMSSLLDANRALTGNLPNGFLKRPHWLRAGKALVSAAETGEPRDIEEAFETIVIALEEEGWLTRDILIAPPLMANPADLGIEDEKIEWLSAAIAPDEEIRNEEIGANVDTHALARRTEEPLWRRILPNSVSFLKAR
jgi:hypothetical protein